MSPNEHRAITEISKRLEGRLARVLKLTDTVTSVARASQTLRKSIGRLGYTTRERSGRQGVENTLPSRSDGETTVEVPPRRSVTHGDQVAPVMAHRWNGRLAFRTKPDAQPRPVPSATDLLFEGNSPHRSSARTDGRSRFRVAKLASLQDGILEVVKRMTLPVKATIFSGAEGLRSRSGIVEIRDEQNGKNSRVGPEGRRTSIAFAAFDAGLQKHIGMKPLRRQLASLSQMSAFRPLTSDRTNNQSRDASIHSPVGSSHTKPSYLISSMQRLYSAASAHYPMKDALTNGGSAVRGTEPPLSGHTSSRRTTFEPLSGGWLRAANWATDPRSSADRYRTGSASRAASSETSLVNYSPTVVINNGAESRTLEQRILAVLSEHGYELSELLGSEARKRRRAIF
jgi:hypothetical protein